MIFVQLSEITQAYGLTTLVYILINFLFTIIVLFKAIKRKQRILYIFSLCILFTATSWYSSGLGYLFWILTGEILDYTVYVLIGTVGVPIAILSWLYIYMTLINSKKKNLVLILYAIISIAYEIYILYFLFIAPNAPNTQMIGKFDPNSPLDMNYNLIITIYKLIALITSCGTGIHFAMRSMKIKDSLEVVWKGRFLFISFVLFGFASIFDIMSLALWLLIIIRACLVLSTISFYIGFILPKSIKKLLSIKEFDT